MNQQKRGTAGKAVPLFDWVRSEGEALIEEGQAECAGAGVYDQTVRGMQYQGKSVTEAQNMAAMSTKGKVQVQATLVSIKEMAGWTFYGCLLCAGLMLVLPWRKRNIGELTREYLLKNVDVKSLGRR